MTGIYTSEWRVEVEVVINHRIVCITMHVAVQLDVIDSTAIFLILQLIKFHLQYEIEKPLKSKEYLNMKYII